MTSAPDANEAALSLGRERPTARHGKEERRAGQDFGIVGFDHVDLRFKDREKAKRYFVEQLGLDVIGDGPDHTFLLFGDQVLGLRNAEKGERNQGVDHLALRVAEWTGLKNRLKRARIDVTAEKERAESRSLYLKGPEGLRIELVWRPDPDVHPHDMKGHHRRPVAADVSGDSE